MRQLRHVLGLVGLLLAVLGVGLLGVAQPVGAAGIPPIIRTFNVWAEIQPGFGAPHLNMFARVDDPDGQVPLTIASVVVTAPGGSTFNLPYNYPNLDFRGQYFIFNGTPVTGTYTLAVTDTQGNTVTATDTKSAFPPLLPPTVTFPQNEQILTTVTPTFSWSPVAGAGSINIWIRNRDVFVTQGGDTLYLSLLLPGTATQYTLPPGLLIPGRRYVVSVRAFDVPNGFSAANVHAETFVPFSVAGAHVSLFLNQNAFHTGNTLHLGVGFRNDGAPLDARVTLRAGIPGGPPADLSEFVVTLPTTPPDVSTVVNDLLVYTFTGAEPPGNYVLVLRVHKDGTAALSTAAFSFSP